MNQPDTSPKPNESQESACKQITSVHTISPEHLRQWIGDRRNRLQEERRALLAGAERLKREIAAHDQLLVEIDNGLAV